MPSLGGFQGKVFISYAHESPAHTDSVHAFARLLRKANLNVIWDAAVAQRRDWIAWMSKQMGSSDAFIVIASPEYKLYAEAAPPDSERRGVQWESATIRRKLWSDRVKWLTRILPVILPGRSNLELPDWVEPWTCDTYPVDPFTAQGLERLLAAVTNIPATDLPAARSIPRILAAPPEIVPIDFQDRQIYLDRLRDSLLRLEQGVISLRGSAGAGKTGLLRRVFDQAAKAPSLPFASLDYISARGYELITAASLVSRIAQAHPKIDERDRLVEMTEFEDISWLDKLDEVLSALSPFKILLALDDVDVMMDAGGRFYDESLHALLENLAARDDHNVTVILVGSIKPYPRLLSRIRDSSIDLSSGLPRPYLGQFLSSLCATAPAGARVVLSISPSTLATVTHGHLRSLELLVALASQSNSDLTSALSSMRGLGEHAVVERLLNLLLTTLPEEQCLALHALAAIGSPAKAEVVHAVLGGDLSRRDIVESLEALFACRVIRSTDGGYYVPADPDSHLILDSMTDPTTDAHSRRHRLYERAAEYFAAQKISEPQRVQDLWPNLREIGLRLEAGQLTKSLALMADIDEPSLQKLGHSDALLPWRRRLVGRLDAYQHEVHNLSRMAIASAEQGNDEEALQSIERATAICNQQGLDRDAQTIRMQLAGQLGRSGQLTAAKDLYSAVLERGMRDAQDGLQVAQARLGLHVSLMGTGHFQRAEQYLNEAYSWSVTRSEHAARTLQAQAMVQKGHLMQCCGAPSPDRWFEQAYLLADSIGEPILAARCLDALAAYNLDSGFVGPAIDFATAAAEVGAKGSNADISRQANGTVALAFLRDDQLSRALAAARSAARFRRSPRSLGALLVVGIAAYRLGDNGYEAAPAFYQALEEAQRLYHVEPESWELLQMIGLAAFGLFLLRRHRSDRTAVDAYRSARSRTLKMPGIRRHALAMLADLSKFDDPDLTRPVLEAAGGAD